MNVFFYTTNPSVQFDQNMAVITALQKVGVKIFSNLEGLSSSLEMPNSIEVLVVLGAGESWDLSYVVALGIARQKPVLYLLSRGQKLPDEITKITQSREIKKVLTVKFYTVKTLDKIVREFLEKKVAADDIYNIKYTLRLNQKLHHYLEWRSKRVKKTKAKLVRSILEDAMNQDQSYKQTSKS